QDQRSDSRPDSRRAEAPRPPRDHERSAPAPRHEERQYTPPAAHRPVVNYAASLVDDEAPSARAERSWRSHERGAAGDGDVGVGG
ncbi:hypothetical protein AB4084_39545, partial [Lysobacter sp. 2RAB21]